ncbi:anaerobic ribonucleoside-triphosphate reductase activating protein [Actinomadura pelletieri DSM 43383]|uniref:Anaerobic ribonucleoside-triphosphate reductase activating protein n=1 Tax=Actinomadura pelletieri DSM 43383 TaxID=1120940 RepID=A0A495R0K7_9ACTN|nr:anaerobic ribonucleoside-triphosphate reductase activating protein [Actinomadura pelletieri DSM 43383]
MGVSRVGVEGVSGVLNVAEVCASTRALGPGVRAVAWVQGCPFRCRGCVAPDWIERRPAREMTPAELADALLVDPEVTGLTFSGGEPMEQAAGLADAARLARERRELTVICFTGYRLEELRGRPGPEALLAEVDVLIDGRYVDVLDDDVGMRGSANQRVHRLTDRLADADLEAGPRRAEIRVRADSALLVGVPSAAVRGAWARIERTRPVSPTSTRD